MTHVLVIGGAGYIGSVLCPRLLDLGYSVTVLDNFMYRHSGANSLAALANHPHFDVFRADVRDFSTISAHLKRADVVIPLAGLVGAPLCNLNPVDAELVNLRHPLELFGKMSDDQLCVMPTTESSYGSNVEVCTEETPLNPLSLYAKHKVVVEDALMQRGNAVSLRLATVFGMSPRMRLDLLVNDFAWRAYKEGSILLFEQHFKRTVLHVLDAADAFIHAIDFLATGIYNVGNITITKQDLCEAIKAKLGGRFYYALASTGTDPDQRNYAVSSAKLEATGFEFGMSLDAGLTELFKGFKALSNVVHSNLT